eukprot:15361127-Ditylum_brightwellii.AAC.1
MRKNKNKTTKKKLGHSKDDVEEYVISENDSNKSDGTYSENDDKEDNEKMKTVVPPPSHLFPQHFYPPPLPPHGSMYLPPTQYGYL